MDEKIINMDTYTYSTIIPDKVIEAYALRSDELQKIENKAYRDALICGIDNYHKIYSSNNLESEQVEKPKVFVKKAGFMDVSMFIDLLIVSVAIILLIMIILGTRY